MFYFPANIPQVWPYGQTYYSPTYPTAAVVPFGNAYPSTIGQGPTGAYYGSWPGQPGFQPLPAEANGNGNGATTTPATKTEEKKSSGLLLLVAILGGLGFAAWASKRRR